jgi:hypothetical protein
MLILHITFIFKYNVIFHYKNIYCIFKQYNLIHEIKQFKMIPRVKDIRKKMDLLAFL